MAKGTLGQGSSREMEPKPWCGLAIQVSTKRKKKENFNITVGDADCIHRVPVAHQTVVVRSSVRGELSSLPAACICRSEKMPVGDRG